MFVCFGGNALSGSFSIQAGRSDGGSHILPLLSRPTTHSPRVPARFGTRYVSRRGEHVHVITSFVV